VICEGPTICPEPTLCHELGQCEHAPDQFRQMVRSRYPRLAQRYGYGQPGDPVVSEWGRKGAT
jgi:hypothetical protein